MSKATKKIYDDAVANSICVYFASRDTSVIRDAMNPLEVAHLRNVTAHALTYCYLLGASLEGWENTNPNSLEVAFNERIFVEEDRDVLIGWFTDFIKALTPDK